MTLTATPGRTFDPRRGGVLAIIFALHLVALLLWTQERRPLPHRMPQVVTILLQAHTDLAARPPARPDGRPRHAPARVAAPVRSAAPSAAPSAAQHAAQHAAQPAVGRPATPPGLAATPAPSPPAADMANPVAPAPDPLAPDTPPDSQATLSGGFAAGLAKRQAGRIDRELRKGKPGVPDEAGTPWARFQRGLESAHIDRTLTLQSDTYTSPDGVVIYRFRQGNHYRCRRAGGVGMPVAGMPGTGSATLPGVNAAMNVDCPKGVVWNQN